MSDFYPGVTPTVLIPGDPFELRALADRLSTLAGGAGDAANELRRISAGSWQGPAASAFEEAVGQQPGRYDTAAGSFGAAATAIRFYAAALDSAQHSAQGAIAEYGRAQDATSTWSSQNARATGAGSHAVTSQSPDPGAAGRSAAAAALHGARSSMDAAAHQLSGSLARAAEAAPARHSGLSALFHEIASIERVGVKSTFGATPAARWFEDVDTWSGWAGAVGFFNDLARGSHFVSTPLSVVDSVWDVTKLTGHLAAHDFADAAWDAGHVIVDGASFALATESAEVLATDGSVEVVLGAGAASVSAVAVLGVSAFLAGAAIGEVGGKLIDDHTNYLNSVESNVTQELYGKDPSQLTPEQADELVSRYQGVGGLVNYGTDAAYSAKKFLSRVL